VSSLPPSGFSRTRTIEFLRDIRSPRWGIYGQGFRFAMSGVVVATVYATATTVLHEVFGLPFELALAIGYVMSAVIHYTLQRLFVWHHDEQFALGAHSQVARYLCVSLSQYGLTALATAKLPSLLGAPVEAVYLTTMLALAIINFVIFRSSVFHAGPAREHHAAAPEALAEQDVGAARDVVTARPRQPSARRAASARTDAPG
jgi:putative flippase GtrA